ncbi:MAG: hypothetical protein KC589_07890 [Nanoarchaeota archaeon]|nr:hypothetical protein [Nanoarchaeota archaeon]
MKLSTEQKKDLLKFGMYVLAGTLLYKFYKKKPEKAKPKTEPVEFKDAEYTEKKSKKKSTPSKEEFLRRMREGKKKAAAKAMTKTEHDKDNKKSFWRW